MARRVERWPRFRLDEVVRVVADGGLDRRSAWFGREGVVDAIKPDAKGRGWGVVVRFGPRPNSGESAPPEEVFWESDLESVGLVERYDGRVPLDPAEFVSSFHELTLRVFVPMAVGPLEELVRRVASACVEILPGAEIDANGRPDDQYDDHWWIWLEIQPADPTREAFELLAASYPHWQNRWDDGWTADFAWWRKQAPLGQDGWPLPEADSMFLDVMPYSDPTYRPVTRGRNRPFHEGGGRDPTLLEKQLHGIPPPLGYTDRD